MMSRDVRAKLAQLGDKVLAQKRDMLQDVLQAHALFANATSTSASRAARAGHALYKTVL